MITKEATPASSSTVKSATEIPCPGPDPSLSVMVPIPVLSTIEMALFEIFDNVMFKSSDGSITASSIIPMVTTWVSPVFVPSGKVTSLPGVIIK